MEISPTQLPNSRRACKREAFYAYMDRRQTRPRGSAIDLDAPDWEEKVQSAIQLQMNVDR